MKVIIRNHILFWFMFVGVNYSLRMVEYLGYKPFSSFFDTIIKHGFGIVVFYAAFYHFSSYNLNRRFVSIFYFLGLLFLYGSIRFIVYKYLYKFIDIEYVYPYSYFQSYASGFWFFYQYTLFAIAYTIFLKSKISNQKFLLEQQKNHSLQTENLKLEYKFLRAQINPHFLYNVLGYFYNKVNTKDENAGRGIMLLTEMMRYSIREAEADDKVLLREEIQAINNLLDLQKLRFEGSTHTAMYVTEGMDTLRIVPHVLVTLVENACKHGDLTHEDDPLKISAQLTDGWFVFTTVNRIRTATSVERTDGFGLENLATRLHLQYDDNQYFAYGKEGGYYKVTFKLKAAIMAEDDIAANSKTENGNLTPIIEKQNQWLPA